MRSSIEFIWRRQPFRISFELLRGCRAQNTHYGWSPGECDGVGKVYRVDPEGDASKEAAAKLMARLKEGGLEFERLEMMVAEGACR